MTRQQVILLTVAGVVACGLVWWMADRQYFSPRGELLAELASAQGKVDTYRTAIREATQTQGEIDAIVARTLGGSDEQVDHQLRSRLNRLVEMMGIDGAVVGTGATTALRPPARGDMPRSMRNTIDLVELEAWVTGETTFEKAVELIARLEAEPWLKRVEQVKIDPKDGGKRVGVHVRLVAMYVPGEAPEAIGALVMEPPDLAAYGALARTGNPFALPVVEVAAAPDPAAPEVKPEPQPRPRARYEQWMLTGVAEHGGVAEAWLRHARSGEMRRLNPGEQIHDAVFLTASGDRAEFEINGTRCFVAVGSDLKNGRVAQP